MPVLLIFAFAASLSIHGMVLFGPDYELPGPSDPPPLHAELKPLPNTKAHDETANPPTKVATVSEHKAAPAKKPVRKTVRAARTTVAHAPASPVSVPEAATADAVPAAAKPADVPPEAAPAAAVRQMPAAGRIRYRVDRGDQGFQVGLSVNDWQVVDGAYRITSVTETTGLVGMLRPLRIEYESRGHTSADGLVPDQFIVRQNGQPTENGAEFDWAQKQLKMGNRPLETLQAGSQDVLSLPYHLGMLTDPASVGHIAITTGKKYGQFRLEVVGEEEISVPAGNFHALHLRVPGVAQTEVWLARDAAQLPVKVQHVDGKGNVLVLVAMSIEAGSAP